MSRPAAARAVLQRTAWVAAGLVSGAAPPVAAQTPTCSDPRLAGLEAIASAPEAPPDAQPYERLRVGEVPLGVGHLRPVIEAYLWDWHLAVRLPLFAQPGDDPIAWLFDGWLVPRGSAARPLGTGGMIETEYETPSFIVLERRSDGWLHLRVEPEVEGGTAWTHECLLGFGPAPLTFEPWADRFTSPDISPLFFHSEVPHILRSEPSLDGARVLTIPASIDDYQIDPLEVRGDWMRVRVSIPRTYCDPDAPAPRGEEGWVRWRDDERGPWLWYFTRGC